MDDRPDRRGRKDAVARWKAQQRAAVRANMPLADAQMQGLFDFLSGEFPRQGCDRTLRLTRQWLSGHGLDPDPVLGWLQENGGCCDCEALANAEEAWQSARPEPGQ